MISKLAISAFLASQVTALQSKGTTPYASASSPENFLCHQCVAEGYAFCAKDTTYSRIASLTAGSTCKAAAADCASVSGTSALAVGTNNIVEFAQMACPTTTGACGDATNQMQYIEDLTTEKTAAPNAAIAALSGCTYGFKTKCGAPYVLTAAPTADAAMTITHYTKDSRMEATSYASDTAATPVATAYPSYTVVPNNLDTTCTTSKCSSLIVDTQRWIYRKDSSSNTIQIEDVLMEYNNYQDSIMAYYKTFVDQFRLYAHSGPGFFDHIFAIMTFGLVQKERSAVDAKPPAAYAGTKWWDLTTQGGWGDLSIQTVPATTTGYFEFGMYGAAQNEPGQGDYVSMAVDSNQVDCTERYAIVNIYNTHASNTLSVATSTVKSKARSLYAKLSEFDTPATQATLEGAMAKTVGVLAASAAVAATLF